MSGTCDFCDKEAKFSVNGLRGCADHIEAVFNLALTPVRALLRNWKESKP
jgi:hypothetical protein